MTDTLPPWPKKADYMVRLAWLDLGGNEVGADEYALAAREFAEAQRDAAIARLRLVILTLDALVMTLPAGSNRFLVADTIERLGPLPKDGL